MSSSPSASSDSEGSRRKRQRRDRRTRDEEERPSKRQDRGRWGEGTESPDPERNARDREKEYGRVDRSGRDGERRGDDRRRGDDVRSSGRRRGERSDDDRRARRREEEEDDRRRRRRHERDEEDRRRERRRDDGRRDDRERREPERRERDDGRRRDSDDTGRSRGRDREERARYGNERGGDRRERDDGKIRRGRGHLDRGRTITAEKASGKEVENGRGPAEGEVGAGPASAASKDAAGGKSEKAGRTGGVYIPPFKLAQMMQQVDDKGSEQYQRMTWDALRKSINGLINKVNSANLRNILPELFSENLLRGKGLFARSLMKSQMASPGFTPVYAAMLAVVNTKFPELGELFIHRIVLAFKRAFKRNDRGVLMSAVKMIGHLTNQGVLHEMLALEVLMLLLDTPTDDSVEVAVEFTKEVGAFLQEESPQALNSVFERFRAILHEGEIDKRVQFMIEGLFAVRKASFAKSGHPAVPEDLDLVEEEDQITHEVSLEDALDGQPTLDVFKQDAEYEQNEAKYAAVKRELLGEESEDEDDEEGGEKEGGGEDDSDDDDDDDDDEDTRVQIEDRTDTNVVTLRRTIYLTIMSSMDFEECGHKLMKIPMAPGQEIELATMLVECCSQERTYLRYYGLLSQRFCYLKRAFQECFEDLFSTQYQYVHRLETNKVRNLAKLFAHLLGTDAISWQVLADIVLTENTTTSASRIFIKYLFQELSENLGLVQLNSRLLDPDCAQWFRGIFPKDNTINMRFCINFFTAIGLGGLTDQMRADLLAIMEEQKKRRLEEAAHAAQAPASSSSSSSSESDSSSDSESGSDTTSSSGSEDESNGSDSD